MRTPIGAVRLTLDELYALLVIGLDQVDHDPQADHLFSRDEANALTRAVAKVTTAFERAADARGMV